MARDRHPAYGEDDRDRRRPRQSTSAVTIVILVLAGLALAGCLVVGAFAVLWSQVESDRSPPKGAPDPAKPVYTWEEFQTLVIGKTEAEVIAAVGLPDATKEDQDGTPRVWTYRGRVTNPATGTAEDGFLDFEGRKVVRARW